MTQVSGEAAHNPSLKQGFDSTGIQWSSPTYANQCFGDEHSLDIQHSDQTQSAGSRAGHVECSAEFDKPDSRWSGPILVENALACLHPVGAWRYLSDYRPRYDCPVQVNVAAALAHSAGADSGVPRKNQSSET